MNKLPPVSKLKKVFLVRDDGALVWREQKDKPKTWNTRFAGAVAGSLEKSGYVLACIDYKKYRAHRIVFAITYGYDPHPLQIDHIDGNRSNNRPCNLRVATNSQNNANKNKLISTNKTGARGVCFKKATGRFQASVGVNGKNKHVGYFGTIQDAAAAAEKAREKHFGEFVKAGGPQR